MSNKTIDQVLEEAERMPQPSKVVRHGDRQWSLWSLVCSKCGGAYQQCNKDDDRRICPKCLVGRRHPQRRPKQRTAVRPKIHPRSK